MALERVFEGMKRGFLGRCPNCGKDRLFYKYLKVQGTCETCSHDNGQYPSDDGPAYFTILIVGHVMVAPLVVLPFIWTWPAQYVLLVTLPLVTVLTLWLLPRVKGAVIGLLWAIHRGEGNVPGQEPDTV